MDYPEEMLETGSEHQQRFMADQTFLLEQNGDGIQLRSATTRSSHKKMRDVPYESTEGYVTRDSKDFKFVMPRSIGQHNSPGRKIVNSGEENYYRRVSASKNKMNIEEQKEMSGYEAASFSEVPESAADQKYYSTANNKKRQMMISIE